MKEKYISPELVFLRVKTEEIILLSKDAFVDAGDSDLFG